MPTTNPQWQANQGSVDIAAMTSKLTGREARRTVLFDKTWREATMTHGAPEAIADTPLGMDQSARRGELAATDPTLAPLLGRRSRTMHDVLAELLKSAAGQPRRASLRQPVERLWRAPRRPAGRRIQGLLVPPYFSGALKSLANCSDDSINIVSRRAQARSGPNNVSKRA